MLAPGHCSLSWGKAQSVQTSTTPEEASGGHLWRCTCEGGYLLPERLEFHLLLNIQVLGPPQLNAQVLALLRVPFALEVAEAEVCL